jgi:integrase
MKSGTNARARHDGMARRPAPKRTDGHFHLIKPGYAENSLSRALDSGLITEDDKTLIETFVIESQSSKGFGINHANKITFDLVRWRNYLGSYRKNTYIDILKAITQIKTAPIRDARDTGKLYSKHTLKDFISILKSFYLWLIENGHSKCPRDKILDIKVPIGSMMTKTVAQCLTQQEISSLIDACIRPMDMAIIAVLFEGALRIQELCTLTWGQVCIREQSIVVNVDGKTGFPRCIPLVFASPYLRRWKSDYPYDITEDALVFVGIDNKPYKYGAIRKHLADIAQRAGVTKGVNPHIFRHSGITDMHKKGYSDTAIMDIGWGNRHTKMRETYIHILPDDIEQEILEKNGIKPKAAQRNSLLSQQCPHCAMVNTRTATFCYSCGSPISEDAIATMEQLQYEIEVNPIYKHLSHELELLRKQISTGAVVIS